MISVIIPCFNQSRFLAEALESVFAQTRQPSQVIVVDDGSSDDTRAVAASHPGVTYVHQPNRGLARARNRGLEAATGEYLVFLDADDRLLPEALASGVGELEAHPDCALTFGRCERIDHRGNRLPTVPPAVFDETPYDVFLRCNPIWTPAVGMFRRARCENLLHFDPSVNPSADYDLYLRIARQLPVRAHRKVVAEYRLHDGCMSLDPGLMLRSTVRVLRAQRRYLGDSGKLLASWQEGLRGFRHHYGERLIEQMLGDLRTPNHWMHVLRDAAILVRWHPVGVLRYAYRRRGQAIPTTTPAEPLPPVRSGHSQ